jgi:CRISPR-associated protein Cas1
MENQKFAKSGKAYRRWGYYRSYVVDGLGFDPYLGYFHEVEYGRASLSSDLQEEFRAAVDRFTFFLINNRMLNNEDFFPNQKDGSIEG